MTDQYPEMTPSEKVALEKIIKEILELGPHWEVRSSWWTEKRGMTHCGKIYIGGGVYQTSYLSVPLEILVERMHTLGFTSF